MIKCLHVLNSWGSESPGCSAAAILDHLISRWYEWMLPLHWAVHKWPTAKATRVYCSGVFVCPLTMVVSQKFLSVRSLMGCDFFCAWFTASSWCHCWPVTHCIDHMPPVHSLFFFEWMDFSRWNRISQLSIAIIKEINPFCQGHQ